MRWVALGAVARGAVARDAVAHDAVAHDAVAHDAVAPKLCGRQSNEGVARSERFNSAIPDVVASV